MAGEITLNYKTSHILFPTSFFPKKNMSADNTKLIQMWNTIKEQLIVLCALNKLPKGNDEFKKFLSEDLELKNFSSHTLNSFCYYVLGIIDSEERDKLIPWPVINIKTTTGFRKGLSAMVIELQKRYPWAHIKKLPVSYFVSPCGNETKVLDFVSRLVNLAIHIALDDPELLFMQSGDGLNSREIAIMTEVITKAREKEEKLMLDNLVPLKQIEHAKNELNNKRIALRQKHGKLQQQLHGLKKCALNAQIVQGGEKINSNDLKQAVDEKILILNTINEELLKYSTASKELQKKLNAFKNQSTLCSTNFGCQSTPLDLNSATSRVCQELCQFFQCITQKNLTKEQEDHFYNLLKQLKESLENQNAVLNSLLCNVSLERNTKF